jgi:hypothetical protein
MKKTKKVVLLLETRLQVDVRHHVIAEVDRRMGVAEIQTATWAIMQDPSSPVARFLKEVPPCSSSSESRVVLGIDVDSFHGDAKADIVLVRAF